jgi:hypothetical protein
MSSAFLLSTLVISLRPRLSYAIPSQFDIEIHPEPPPQNTERRRSSITKIFDVIKKPFSTSSKKEKEKDIPPALQEAIDKMEQRKQSTMKQMDEEGRDTKR